MSDDDVLSGAALARSMSALPFWHHDAARGAILREFRLASFSQAFGFMTRVALLAEKAGHHPDWSNSYDRVTIALSTHDAGGITPKDIALAQAIDALIA